ncbi:MAG: putative DNA-binding domain-containing protein [Gammaproteobacteria bacterium]|nr:putative DNA-binding domain-containing protein [Gammaproteobacteria bacterium]
MSRQGSNLPGFREHQLDFASHIRNPQENPRPDDIDPRRMQIYLDLFYNNIERFLANGFPITKQVLGDELWHRVARDFVHRHPSDSPYFLEISQEFLTYLDQAERDDLPDFVLELCHYEWVELALSVAEEEIPTEGIDSTGDLLAGRVVVSPLIWALSYRYPVHQIGPGFQPDAPSDEPTQLVVYRRRDDRVRFLEANAVTIRLLELLAECETGAEAIRRLQVELPAFDSQVVHDQGLATMATLRESEIILGIEISGAD